MHAFRARGVYEYPVGECFTGVIQFEEFSKLVSTTECPKGSSQCCDLAQFITVALQPLELLPWIEQKHSGENSAIQSRFPSILVFRDAVAAHRPRTTSSSLAR